MIKNRAIIEGNIWYWIVTNFLCWIAWYEHDVNGFLYCYYLAVPFFFTATMKTWMIIRGIELTIGAINVKIHGRNEDEKVNGNKVYL